MLSRALQCLHGFSSTFDITVSFATGLSDYFGFQWIYTQLKTALKFEMVNFLYNGWLLRNF